MNISKGFKLFLGAAALVCVAACGGGGEGPDAPAAAPPPPADPQTRATIGAAGGEVAFADQRFKLTIPAGALGNATEIVITEVSPANVPANLKPLSADKVYRLEPSGLQFAQPVTATAQLPPSDTIALMVHESNGTFEDPAAHQVVLAKDGRTVSGQITHFSNVAVFQYPSISLRMDLAPKSLQVGQALTANVTIDHDGSSAWDLVRSSFSSDNVEVQLIELPPTPTRLERGAAKTLTGSLFGRCRREGTGSVTYEVNPNAFNAIPALSGFELSPRILVFDIFACVGPSGGINVATGVFPAGVSAPDDIRVFNGPFANLTGTGPFASVAGTEGTVVINLVTRQTVIDWTRSGPERDALGSPLIGVLPVTQPGANAPAAMFGFGTTGLSTVRTALRNYDPASSTFGFTGISFAPTFDASTVGGETIANAFLSIGPGGIQQYGFDATTGYQATPDGAISALRFPGGQLVSAFRPTAAGAILAVTRGHDGNTTSRLWAHSGTSTEPATPIATLPAEARRIRCTNVRANASLCGITAASGTVTLFLIDAANPTAVSAPLTVPTGNGTLGIALGKRANGNPYAVVANQIANSLNVIEVKPDLSLVANTGINSADGFTGPAHVSLLTDGEGEKAVVTGNGSANLWVTRLFP